MYNRLHYYKWDCYVKGACEDMAQHKKDYITLNIKMDAAQCVVLQHTAKMLVIQKLWPLSA